MSRTYKLDYNYTKQREKYFKGGIFGGGNVTQADKRNLARKKKKLQIKKIRRQRAFIDNQLKELDMVLTLNFEFFCAIQWKHLDVDIMAASRIQLIRAFIEETRGITRRTMNEREARKELWERASQCIQEVKFPLVTTKYL